MRFQGKRGLEILGMAVPPGVDEVVKIGPNLAPNWSFNLVEIVRSTKECKNQDGPEDH